jgi:capsular polysaccharide biosynthesis protein
VSVRWRWATVGVATVLGLLAGAGYATLSPPTLTSDAIVALPPSIQDTTTQVVIVASNPVLAAAAGTIHPAISLKALRSRVQVKSLTSNLLSISAQGQTASQAEDTANAVTSSYIAYVRTSKSAAGTVQAHLLEPATNASGSSLSHRLLVTGGLGALLGLLIGAISVIALSRSGRRFRMR